MVVTLAASFFARKLRTTVHIQLPIWVCEIVACHWISHCDSGVIHSSISGGADTDVRGGAKVVVFVAVVVEFVDLDIIASIAVREQVKCAILSVRRAGVLVAVDNDMNFGIARAEGPPPRPVSIAIVTLYSEGLCGRRACAMDRREKYET